LILPNQTTACGRQRIIHAQAELSAPSELRSNRVIRDARFMLRFLIH
jgi:hypothetical protein